MNAEESAQNSVEGGQVEDLLLEELFYFAENSEIAFSRIRALSSRTPNKQLQEIVEAFLANLESVVWVANMPEFVARSGATQLVAQQVFQRERLLARADQLRALREAGGAFADLPEDLDAVRALTKKLLPGEEPAIKSLTKAALRLLLIGDKEVARAPQELLRQALVICWSSLEVLSNDLFVLLVNEYPDLVTIILQDEGARKLIKLSSLGIDTLTENGFDLSRKMGDVISRDLSIDSVLKMKIIFGALFPEATEVRTSLASRDLWVLNQRRHIILHRRGIIDQQYVRSTGESAEAGAALRVTVSALRTYLQCVEVAGYTLLSAATHRFC